MSSWRLGWSWQRDLLLRSGCLNPQTFALEGADLKKSGLELLLLHGRWGWLLGKVLNAGLPVWQKEESFVFCELCAAELDPSQRAVHLWDQLLSSASAGHFQTVSPLVWDYFSPPCFWRVQPYSTSVELASKQSRNIDNLPNARRGEIADDKVGF